MASLVSLFSSMFNGLIIGLLFFSVFSAAAASDEDEAAPIDTWLINRLNIVNEFTHDISPFFCLAIYFVYYNRFVMVLS